MAELHVTSASNPRLRAVLALRRRRVREAEGRTVVDGFEELSLALDAGVVPDTVLHCPGLMLDAGGSRPSSSRPGPSGASTIRLSRTRLREGRLPRGPDGFLAVVPVAGVALADLDLPADPLVLVCEGVEKPGNLGAMLRTAEAAGVAAVVAADPVTDWGNPNVVRASKGTVFSVPVATADDARGVGWLRDQRHPTRGHDPRHGHVHTAVDYRGAVAVAVGTEKTGLTDVALGAAAERVRIPMVGRVNSSTPRPRRPWSSTRRSGSAPREAPVARVTGAKSASSRSGGPPTRVKSTPCRVRR